MAGKIGNGEMNNKGQTLVEFALVAVLFFTVTFAVVDLAIMLYVNLTMQHAVRTATRYAVTGQRIPGNDKRQSLIQKIKDNSCGLYDKNANETKAPTICVLTPSEVTSTSNTGTVATGDPGGRDDVIMVSLTYAWPLLTPLLKPFFPQGRYTFTVRSTMKNEPF